MTAGQSERSILVANVSASLLLVVVAVSRFDIGPIGGQDSVALGLVSRLLGYAVGEAASGRIFGVAWYWWAAVCCLLFWTFIVALKRKLSPHLKLFLGIWFICGIAALLLGSIAGPGGLMVLRQGSGFHLAGLPLVVAFLGTALATGLGLLVLMIFPVIAIALLALKRRIAGIVEARESDTRSAMSRTKGEKEPGSP